MKSLRRNFRGLGESSVEGGVAKLSGDFDVAMNGGLALFRRLFVGLAPGRARGNVWDDSDIGIVLVNPEDFYLESVLLGLFYPVVSFCI